MLLRQERDPRKFKTEVEAARMQHRRRRSSTLGAAIKMGVTLLLLVGGLVAWQGTARARMFAFEPEYPDGHGGVCTLVCIAYPQVQCINGYWVIVGWYSVCICA